MTAAGWHYSYGNYVVIEHEGGVRTLYAHLGSLNVGMNDQVEQGAVIGTVGTTAVSESADASHLHFSMREYGVAIDPLNYLH